MSAALQEVEAASGGERPFSDRALFSLFWPLVIEQGLEYLVGFTATFLASSVGESAVSGVSLVDTVMMLLIAVFAALATGGAVISGQHLGNRRPDLATAAARQLVVVAGIASIGIAALLYWASPLLLGGLFGEISPEVRHHASTYLMLVNASVPGIALYAAGAALFRTIGRTRTTMHVAILMNVTNIGLSAALVYGFQLGTLGIGIGSLVSRLLAAAVMLWLAFGRDLPVRLSFTGPVHAWLDRATVGHLLRLGMPFALENGIFHVGRILVLGLIATFGTSSIAANAVGTALVLFQVLPGMSIGLGLTTVVSRCVGAGRFDLVRFYTRRIVGFVYLSQIILSLVILALLPWLLQAYALSPETASMVWKLILVHTAGVFLIWPLAYTLPVTLRAAGDARFPMLVSVLCMFAVRLGLAWILGRFLGWGVAGVWAAMVIEWLPKTVLFVSRYRGERWMRFRIAGA